jgi:hypothetical protein
VQHAAELILACDGLTVDLENDVVLAQTGFAGGCIVVDEDDLRATRIFQLERWKLVGGDVADADAEIALRGSGGT